MARKRRNINQNEERRHPDSPDGLVYIAACNPDYGKKLAQVFRQQQERVKNDGRR
ncbi:MULTISPECIES: hypothetical protein [Serratia]|jgi:hypothetical protein|uniref:hypothetical protein n=1 Tax=Serratia TaxID=613 RepID=UPI000B1DA488|nr:hypothetical protein [Serratia marcescens]MBN5184912.1 hypothetical protein [Serratia marcescens]MBN5194660.1 hypothetical protein [Serratia marcescens]MBN5380753.1 hypothetical protein [Serratia marcescens]QHJ76856.1 MAG: hypothetical protein [Caudoviricetes sp.]